MTSMTELNQQLTGRNGDQRVGREAETIPGTVEIIETSPVVCNVNKDMATLYGKMAAIMGIVGSVARDGTNAHFNYKFQRSDDVYNAVRKAMADQKIAFFCSMTDVSRNGKMTYATFQFTLACGDTGAAMTSQWHGEAMDSGDKGINKVATAATKYFLLKTFLIGDPGEVDPDSESGIPDSPTKAKQSLPSAEKPAEPAAKTPPVTFSFDGILKEVIFMYDHVNHAENSVNAMIDTGEIEAKDTTRAAIWKVFLHRALSKPLNFPEQKVMEALTAFREAEGSNVPVGSIAQWVKDGGTIEQAWQAVKAYKALEDSPPAKAKTEQPTLPGTPKEDVPF